MLRLFETGFREESRIIMNLRQAGIQVWDRGDDGEQIRFEMFGGKFAGSIDGIVLGLPEAPKTEHLLEIKTSSDKNYKALIKNGVEKAKPVHYAQMQVYLGAFNLTRALYIVVNKNTDEIYTERLEFDNRVYQSLLEKAERIVTSDAPLERFESFECKWCEYQKICEWEEMPHICCRTCAHWGGCETETLCDKHIWNPNLINSEPIDADEQSGWILYANGLKNGPGFMSSEEIKAQYH
jgi:CRISPR/Cas system-associated exonuclease Cas4 (RecB family)